MPINVASLHASLDLDDSGFRRKVEDNKRAFQDLARELSRASGFGAVSQGATTAEQSLEKLQRTTETVKGGMQRFGEGMTRVGKQLSVALTLPLVALGRQAVGVFGEYERNLDEFGAVAHATAGEMTLVSAKAKELGADLKLPGTSAAGAAEALVELRKGGISTKDTLDAARPALVLAAATLTKGGDAARFMASSLNQFHLSGTQAIRIADQLAGVTQNTTARIGELQQAFRAGATTFYNAGFSVEDLTTSLGLMAKAGITGAKAGTQLRVFVTDLVPRTKQAADTMKKLGIETLDAHHQIKPLREQIDAFSQALSKLPAGQRTKVIRDIFGERGGEAARILSGGVEAFDKMRAAVTRQGQAAELAAAKNKGLWGAFDAFKSAFETAAIAGIETVAKDLRALALQAAELVNKFAQLSPETRRMWIMIAAGAALLGPVLIVLGQLVSAFGTLVGAGGAAATALGISFAAIAAPVAAAAAVLIAAFVAYQTNFLGFRDTVNTTAAVIAETCRTMAADVRNVFTGLWESVGQPLVETFKNVRTQILAAFQTIGPELGDLFRRIYPEIAGPLGLLMDSLHLIVKKKATDWGATITGAIVSAASPALGAWVQNRMTKAGETVAARANANRVPPGMGSLHSYEFANRTPEQIATDQQAIENANRLRAAQDRVATERAAAAQRQRERYNANLAIEKQKKSPQEQDIKQVQESIAGYRQALAGMGQAATQVVPKFGQLNAEQAEFIRQNHLAPIGIRLMNLALKEQVDRLHEAQSAQKSADDQARSLIESMNAKTRELRKTGLSTGQETVANQTAKASPELQKAAQEAKQRLDVATKEATAQQKVVDVLARAKAEYEALGKAIAEGRNKGKPQSIEDRIPGYTPEIIGYRDQIKALLALRDAEAQVDAENAAANTKRQSLIDGLKGKMAELRAEQLKRLQVDPLDQASLTLTGQTYKDLQQDTSDLGQQIREWVDDIFNFTEHEKRATEATKNWNDAQNLQAAAAGDLQAKLHAAAIEHAKLTGATKENILTTLGLSADLDLLDADVWANVQALEAYYKSARQIREGNQFIQQFADGTQRVFSDMFTNLAEHGFGGFFKSVYAGFKQMLVSMASEYLSSQLIKLLMGTPNESGTRSGGAAGGFLTQLFGIGLGALGGGGGGGAAAGGSAALGSALHGWASGGPMTTQGGWVGERGPEYFRPRVAGTIIPHGGGTGGGPSIVQHITIQATDYNSFHRNRDQVGADMFRAAARHTRRNGG